MYTDETLFSKLIARKIPADIVYEDDKVLAFRDIQPKARHHVLVIPKKKYVSYEDFLSEATEQEIVHFFKVLKHVASHLGLSEKGYRLVTNHGPDSGQEVFHFHFHLLGGTQLGSIA